MSRVPPPPGHGADTSRAAEGLRRAAGVCGTAGAALFFAGDMLMYGHLGAGSDFASGASAAIRNAPEWRLFVGGLMGPAAACLCTLGFWHIITNLHPGRLRIVVFALGFASMAALGATHVLWVAKGLLARSCSDGVKACDALRASVNVYWNAAYYLGAIPGYAAAVVLAVAILIGASRYPRWTLALNPALTGLLMPLAVLVPAPLGAVLVGGDANLSLMVFFLASTLVTWRPAPRDAYKATS